MSHLQDEPSSQSVEGTPAPKTDSGPRAWIHILIILAKKGLEVIGNVIDRGEKVKETTDLIKDLGSKKCFKCGARIAADARYCERCGERQPEA